MICSDIWANYYRQSMRHKASHSFFSFFTFRIFKITLELKCFKNGAYHPTNDDTDPVINILELFSRHGPEGACCLV
jgi:hypothetical protein